MADLRVKFRFPFARNIGGKNGTPGYNHGNDERESFEGEFHGRIVWSIAGAVKNDVEIFHVDPGLWLSICLGKNRKSVAKNKKGIETSERQGEAKRSIENVYENAVAMKNGPDQV